MPEDQPFRLALIIGALLVIPVMARYRIKSSRPGEKLDRSQEGARILFSLRPLALAGMLGLLVFMINPAWMVWSALPLPAAVRWAGVAMGAVAAGLLIWTVRTLGPNLTDTVVTRQQHCLVVSGPYRYVQHPFYFASGLAVLANAIVAANGFLLLMGSLTYVLLIIRANTEERHLLARFGEAYAHYAANTPRLFPFPLPFAKARRVD